MPAGACCVVAHNAHAPPLHTLTRAATRVLQNLEPEHVEILLSVLQRATLGEDGGRGARPDGFGADTERWLEVLKAIELHVYVALADDELCNNIVSLLFSLLLC